MPASRARAALSHFLCLLLLALSGTARAAPLAAPVSEAELRAEIKEKLRRVERWLGEQKLGGVLLRQSRNIAWLTAGQGPSPVVITGEAAPYALLVLKGGKRYVLASASEMQRVQDEELRGQGYTGRAFAWHEDRLLAIARELVAGKPLGSDLAEAGLSPVDLIALRTPLTPSEIKKYRWLGRHTSEVVVEVARQLKPGMNEKQIEALTSDALMRRQIRPTVLLIGTDDRLFKYRHATPAEGTLKSYGMVNVCARRWGLVIAVTRFVHFGKLPAVLARRFQVAARMNAEYLAASRPGATAGEILARAQAQYEKLGFKGQWQKHHQGGAIGYAERDWVARPGGKEKLQAGQAVAWNPTVEGAKVEDTVLVTEKGLENLTETPGWPVVSHTVDGRTIRSPEILVR